MTKVLVRLKPEMNQEFHNYLERHNLTEDEVTGVKSIPEENITVTHEKMLVVIFPHRLDCAIGFKPTEYIIL